MHHKILLPPPIFPVDLQPIFLSLKVISVQVLPNGNLIDKATDLSNSFTENLDTNTFTFISPANHIKSNHLFIHLYGKGNCGLLTPSTMIEILKLLPSSNFMQIHDSYIINKNFAVSACPHFEINLYHVELPLPISRSFSNEVDKMLFPNCTYHYGKSCPYKAGV